MAIKFKDMICEYWNNNQFELASKTNDADINDLLKKVRKIDDRYYVRTTEVQYKGIFDTKQKYFYELSFRAFRNEEVQIMLNHQVDDGLSTWNDRLVIMGYLLGFLNGHHRQIDNPSIQTKEQPESDVIKFGAWLSGHDEKTVRQMYNDWKLTNVK